MEQSATGVTQRGVNTELVRSSEHLCDVAALLLLMLCHVPATSTHRTNSGAFSVLTARVFTYRTDLGGEPALAARRKGFDFGKRRKATIGERRQRR